MVSHSSVVRGSFWFRFLSIKKKQKKLPYFYLVPVSVMSQLKVVRLSVSDAAVNVRVAWIDCPVFRTVFCRFNVSVSEELALVGF